MNERLEMQDAAGYQVERPNRVPRLAIGPHNYWLDLKEKHHDRFNLADIPVVILAGGKGTRLAEERKSIPKPLVQIGDKSMLKHIIDFYHSFGFKRFIVCGGYKSDLIKDYFLSLAPPRRPVDKPADR